MKTIQISADVREVLSQATVEGAADRPVVKLPEGQLDRALYASVDKVLKALGGKWDRRAGGHVFSKPVEGELAEALASGRAVDTKKTHEQFFTPADLAMRMARLGLDGMGSPKVLEPSAGGGALIHAALACGAASVIAVEVDALLADRITADERVSALCADFLTVPVLALNPDVVLMNPPFSRNQDIAHVRRAFDFLRPGGRLVAVMSPHWTFASDRASIDFRSWLGVPGHIPEGGIGYAGGGGSIESMHVEHLPAGTFKAEGTSVSAVLVQIEKAGA